MLIDHIVEYCDEMYKIYVSSNPCNECNHPNSCRGDCSNCLDEVHFPSQRSNGRCEYDCEKLLYYYTCKYSHKYCSEIIYSLKEINLDNYPSYNILSLGCGATPDLMAFDCLETWRIQGTSEHVRKNIRYRGYDRNNLWKLIHNEIESYTSVNMDVKC